MEDGRWAVVWDLFSAASELPPIERSAFLRSSTLSHDERDAVRALLEASQACSMQTSFPVSQAASPEYPMGYELDRYKVVGVIGEGGFGRIYAAHDKELNRVVALKVLSGSALGQRERLIDEARAASALNHPNILTVYETIPTDDGNLAIVMEFVDGKALRMVLRASAGPLPVAQVLRNGRQVAEALKTAHEAGITHRDIKPENILVRQDGYVKLVDFGLARNVLEAPEQAGSEGFAGTMRYMSPEQFRGEPSSAASDIFSLGLVMWEMTTGVHPFRRETPLEAAQAIATVQAEPPSRVVPKIPPELDRLILSMLAKDPAVRPDAAHVARDLEHIAARGDQRSNGRRIWIAAAILVATLGTGAALLPKWTSKRNPTLRLDSRPLTGDEGHEHQPLLSPDGRYVLYSWQETPVSNPVTIVREVGTDQHYILKIPPPFGWLPDSRHVGFLRRGKNQDALCSVSLDGNDVTDIMQATAIHSFDFSPDGAGIAYSAVNAVNGRAVYLYSTRTKERRQITFPAPSVNDIRPTISPSGKQVAFRRSLAIGNSDVFVGKLAPDDQPRQLSFDHRDSHSIAWVSNGSAVITSSFQVGNNSLWLHWLREPQNPVRLTEVGIEVSNVRSASHRNRLTWENSVDDTNIWRVPVTGGQPSRIIASATFDHDVACCGGGMVAFRSDRNGFPEIWIATQDGRSPKQVTNLKNFTGSPRWSPNGQNIVFDSRPKSGVTHLFQVHCDTARLECGALDQLTDHSTSDVNPNWSADGEYIYFASQRAGQWQIFRIPAKDKKTPPFEVTTKGGFTAAESADGKWLYYSRIDSKPVTGVWRKPLAGMGTPSYQPDDEGEMVIPMEFSSTDSWVLSGGDIFYSTFGNSATPSGVWGFNLEKRRNRLIYHSVDKPVGRGIAFSPMAKTLYFARWDRWQSTVVVADYEIVE